MLQNRPQRCEVVVVLNRKYDDPYDLASEVRFVHLPEIRSVAEAAAQAIPLCRAPIMHLLVAGVEVDEGWTEAALAHFYDDRIAVVAPLLLTSRSSDVIESAGIEYHRGGRTVRRGHGAAAESMSIGGDVLGTPLFAGFYRRAALTVVPRAFETAVTDEAADADLALQLKSAGYRAVYESGSIVYREAATLPPTSSFTAGRGAQRLFFRNVHLLGRPASLLAHPFTLLGEVISSRSLADKLGRLLGRAAAMVEVLAYHRHRQALKAVGRPGLALTATTTSTGDRVRIDGPHLPHRTATARSGKRSEQAQ